MRFDLSEDQLALADAARDLLDDFASPDRVRAHIETGEPWDAQLWKAMVDQGWLGVTVDGERGGLGLGWVEAVVLLEQIGRHVAPAPLLGTLLAGHALAATPWADTLASGEQVGCVAWSGQPEAVSAHPAGEGWELSGRTDPVIGASGASVAVVWTPGAVYAVNLETVGRPAPQPSMDQSRSLAWLALDRTPAIAVGGREEAEDLLDRAAAGASAEMLGGASRVLEMAADYAKSRVQFGQPIGVFQAVKHRCADMVVDVEGMRSSVWYGAWCCQAGHADRSLAASSAKVWCSEASRRVMASGLQVHGGIGFTWEHDLHLYLKRAQLDQVSFGNARFHRDRLARLLRQRVDAGVPVI
jgi:alkylation response protein AidB-like acyl-CoA dehydrogenase